jgi:mRNA interferase RelE/StbE
MWKIEYTQAAIKSLLSLEKHIQQRIVKKMRFFCDQKNPLVYAKKLRDSKLGEYRFRVGNYRVLFDVTSQGTISVLYVLTIKHRKDIYSSC